jgi:hypothetical protein
MGILIFIVERILLEPFYFCFDKKERKKEEMEQTYEEHGKLSNVYDSLKSMIGDRDKCIIFSYTGGVHNEGVH